jgi:hypothetical protein
MKWDERMLMYVTWEGNNFGLFEGNTQAFIWKKQAEKRNSFFI